MSELLSALENLRTAVEKCLADKDYSEQAARETTIGLEDAFDALDRAVAAQKRKERT